MSEQKAGRFIPQEYRDLIKKIAVSINTQKETYTKKSFESDIKKFFKTTDILYIDLAFLKNLFYLNPIIKPFVEETFENKTEPEPLTKFLEDLEKSNRAGNRFHLHAKRNDYSNQNYFAAMSLFAERFYNETKRELNVKIEEPIQREFIKTYLPSSSKQDQEKYFQKLSSILRTAIQKRQPHQTKVQRKSELNHSTLALRKTANQRQKESKKRLKQENSPNDLAKFKVHNQSLKKEAAILQEKFPTETIFNPKPKENSTSELKESADQRKKTPSYCSSFWSYIKNPISPRGKSAHNGFFDLLLADTVITSLGGILYGISKNPNTKEFHHFISKHIETLKLCAEIIPPAILFISFIILWAGYNAEKKHLAKVWEAQDTQDAVAKQSIVSLR